MQQEQQQLSAAIATAAGGTQYIDTLLPQATGVSVPSADDLATSLQPHATEMLQEATANAVPAHLSSSTPDEAVTAVVVEEAEQPRRISRFQVMRVAEPVGGSSSSTTPTQHHHPAGGCYLPLLHTLSISN